LGSRHRQLQAIALILGVTGSGVAACNGGGDETHPERGVARTPEGDMLAGGARRIVSLIPAATEILFALGAGDRLVGRTRWGVHPPEAESVPDVGDGVRPSLEAVLSRDPDLVILFDGADTDGVADRLAGLGVASLSLRHNTLSDLERNVVALGEVAGCPAAARALNDRIRDDLEAVSAAVDRAAPLRVYYDVWPDPPMTIGRGSFLDSLVTIAGGRNIFGDLAAASPQIGLEAIVQRDPEVVVYAVSGITDRGAAAPRERSGWSVIPAVSRGRVATVDADLLGRLGPRVGDAARELALALRPAAVIPVLDRTPLAASCSR
jgi:iron complex transport system substrate-binding protein